MEDQDFWYYGNQVQPSELTFENDSEDEEHDEFEEHTTSTPGPATRLPAARAPAGASGAKAICQIDPQMYETMSLLYLPSWLGLCSFLWCITK